MIYKEPTASTFFKKKKKKVISSINLSMFKRRVLVVSLLRRDGSVTPHSHRVKTWLKMDFVQVMAEHVLSRNVAVSSLIATYSGPPNTFSRS